MTIKWRKCDRKGHDWFPNLGAQEFFPLNDYCLRCAETRVIAPWGICLTGHPIREHYNSRGRAVPMTTCDSPR